MLSFEDFNYGLEDVQTKHVKGRDGYAKTVEVLDPKYGFSYDGTRKNQTLTLHHHGGGIYRSEDGEWEYDHDARTLKSVRERSDGTQRVLKTYHYNKRGKMQEVDGVSRDKFNQAAASARQEWVSPTLVEHKAEKRAEKLKRRAARRRSVPVVYTPKKPQTVHNPVHDGSVIHVNAEGKVVRHEIEETGPHEATTTTVITHSDGSQTHHVEVSNHHGETVQQEEHHIPPSSHEEGHEGHVDNKEVEEMKERAEEHGSVPTEDNPHVEKTPEGEVHTHYAQNAEGEIEKHTSWFDHTGQFLKRNIKHVAGAGAAVGLGIAGILGVRGRRAAKAVKAAEKGWSTGKKAAVGAAGVAGVGAVGYGGYRMIHSDDRHRR